MFSDILLSGVQLMLIWLKLTDRYDGSWWLVLLPTIVWCVIGIILTATKQKE